MDLTVDHDGFGLHFGLEVGVFSDREGPIGANFAFDPAIDQQVVGELDRSFDVNVVAENITLSARSLAGGGRSGGLRVLDRSLSFGLLVSRGSWNGGGRLLGIWRFGSFAVDSLEHFLDGFS